MPDYASHVFICYASEDAAWASKLETDLNANDVKVFRDLTRLEKGRKWEDGLLENLKTSRHLILLFSTKARVSDWVNEETYRFKELIKYNDEGPREDRRILQVCLDTYNETLSPVQNYQELMKAGAYPDRMDDPVIAPLWKGIVADIANIASKPEPRLVIPVVTVAITGQVMEKSGNPFIKVPEKAGATLADFLALMKVESLEDLKKRYGTAPHDWKPLGGAETIQVLLERQLVCGREALRKRQLPRFQDTIVRWQWTDLMNQSLELVTSATRELRAGPALLIIDPLSLCNELIAQRFRLLDILVRSEKTMVAIVRPFAADPALQSLREWLRYQSAPLLDGYYDPPPESVQYAMVVNASHESDVGRFVKAALMRSDYGVIRKKANPITRTRGRTARSL